MGRPMAVTLKATIWAVKVVPTLAPMMTPMDWARDMSPAVMKPTTSTVVTDEELRTTVTSAPVAAPTKRLRVSEPSSFFMRSAAAVLRPSDIMSMP